MGRTVQEQQERVAAFIRENELEAPPAFRILDLLAEVGEIAADAAKSADYGASEEALTVKRDEIGDALFALLAVASGLGLDAETALEEALDKYERRMAESGSPDSED